VSVKAGYKAMWLFAMFDLPTTTAKERKKAASFRNYLLDLGFLMHQYSIYIRRCSGRERVEVLSKKIKNHIPKMGNVYLISITEKQFADAVHIWDSKTVEKEDDKDDNLLIF
jgi:CRISPR-associated protein Cas2